jgi:hypothetical protein
MLKLLDYWQYQQYFNDRKCYKLGLVVTRSDQQLGKIASKSPKKSHYIASTKLSNRKHRLS